MSYVGHDWCVSDCLSLREWDPPKMPKENRKKGVHLSNEKQKPVCLGYIGDEMLPSYVGDYFINHPIRIPIE